MAFKGLGKTLWSTFKTLLANPITWIVAVGAAIIALHDIFTVSIEEATEALEKTQSELETVNSQIEENKKKIEEIKALGTLSITDKEDLERLQAENKELAIRQKYLEKQEQQDKKQLAESTKDTYNTRFADDEKTKELRQRQAQKSWGTSEGVTGDTLQDAINEVEKYRKLKAEIVAKDEQTDEDVKALEKWDKKLGEAETRLSSLRTELQGYSDNLRDAGDTGSEEFGKIKSDLKEIDNVLLSQGQNLVNFINSDTVGNDKQKIVELAESGELTAEVMKEKFSEVDDYLKENGLTLEDLISILGLYKDELEEVTDTANKIDGLLEDTTKTLSTLEGKYEELKSAQEEYNSTGAISADTMQKLIDNNLLQYLDYSSGKLRINTDALLAEGEAAKVNAIQKLQDAMATDLMNLATGKTDKLSNTAKTAITNLGSSAETAGNKAQTAASKLAGFAVAAQAAKDGAQGKLKKGFSLEDFNTQANAIISAYTNAANLIGNMTIKSPSLSGGSKSNSSSSSSKETKETFDWIETAISRLQRTITNLGKTVSATWKSWTERNSALKSQISSVTQEISKQQQAYNTYMSLANSVGLDPYYQTLVQNGAMNISTITDETLAEQIKTYQEFYEKALDAKDAIIDLQDELKQLEQTDFDNIITQYEYKLSFIEHEVSMLESTADLLENKGYMASASIYDKLIQQENAKISSLESQYKSLMDELASNSIQQGTEQWNKMKLEILEVEESILASKNALVEYNNTLQELDWEVFDKLQEKISDIVDETDFLIELMSDEKMFDDNGITEHGQVTLGLHALNYKTYLAQAKEYASELAQIEEELANDPYNQTLLERENELLESQRDSILAAEDEKQSIKDLVSEGYDNLLNTMDELINKRKDMLSLIKDQYDYEKSIAEQTKEITTLEKQLSAYQGDDSEESRATIQKIKVSLEDAKENLEETQYDKYISDQEKMLDTLYD